MVSEELYLYFYNFSFFFSIFSIFFSPLSSFFLPFFSFFFLFFLCSSCIFFFFLLCFSLSIFSWWSSTIISIWIKCFVSWCMGIKNGISNSTIRDSISSSGCIVAKCEWGEYEMVVVVRCCSEVCVCWLVVHVCCKCIHMIISGRKDINNEWIEESNDCNKIEI